MSAMGELFGWVGQGSEGFQKVDDSEFRGAGS